VSPGKSQEGVFGAIVFAIVFSLAVFFACDVPYRLWFWGVLLSVITILFSVVGDLFESVLKREAGVKDSGKLFPGHGGLLDRIDSLAAAAPIYALGSLLMGTYLQ
jgi:phosphatidate cytidylyltransferase